MALVGRHNIAKMRSSTTGTGTLTLSTAVSGFLTFDLAGVVNSERVTYTIRDGVNTEVGIGTYTSSGTTLSRDTVLSSTNGGSKISCSGNEQVMITVAAEDIQPFALYTAASSVTVAHADPSTMLVISTEAEDSYSLATLSANRITITKKGWYSIFASVGHYSNGADYNGTIYVGFNGAGLVNTGEMRGYITAWAVSGDEMVISVPLIKVTADATSYIEIFITNNSGASIEGYINRVSLLKIGNA
jgi:hypothetical protein